MQMHHFHLKNKLSECDWGMRQFLYFSFLHFGICLFVFFKVQHQLVFFHLKVICYLGEIGSEMEIVNAA